MELDITICINDVNLKHDDFRLKVQKEFNKRYVETCEFLNDFYSNFLGKPCENTKIKARYRKEIYEQIKDEIDTEIKISLKIIKDKLELFMTLLKHFGEVNICEFSSLSDIQTYCCCIERKIAKEILKKFENNGIQSKM